MFTAMALDAPSKHRKRRAGYALIAAGAALLVLPGPGIPLIIGGMALLADEAAWAAKLADRGKAIWRRLRSR